MWFGIRIPRPTHLATSITPIQNHKDPKNAKNTCANIQIIPLLQIIGFCAQIQFRFITALGERKVMDSSTGQHRLGWGCQCKDNTVQPSLGLRVSAKYLHSAHAFSMFLRHFRYLMGIIKVPRWFRHKILNRKHPWKSKIRPLEQILG